MGRPFGSFKPLRPYAEAREFVHTLKLSGTHEWFEWSKSGQRPAGIPGNPRQYRQEFTDWYDWLGTTPRVNQRRVRSEQYRAEREQRRAAREQKRAQRLAEREQKKASHNRSEYERQTAREQKKAAREQRLAEREQAKRQAADRRLAATRERELRRQEELKRLALRRETEKRERMLAAEQVRADIARRRDEIRKYKEETRYQSRIKIVFFERCDSADRFWTLADAEAAAAEYSADRQYGCEAFRCEKCKAVWHVRPRPLAGRVFMHPETKRWCITLAAPVDPKVDRWSAENLAKFRANKHSAAVPNVGNLCIGSAETGVLVMDECLSTC
jgi:hypothetical protein